MPVPGSPAAGRPAGPARLPAVRDELRKLTHERLITAAQAVFERDGYVKATVGNISAAANVNRATFYLHFNNKSEVLLAVMRRGLADMSDYWKMLDAALVAGSREAIHTALGKAFQWYHDHERLLPVGRAAAATDLAVAQQADIEFGRLADRMTNYLSRIPVDRRDDARLRIQLLIVQLDQVAFRMLVQHIGEDNRERLLDVLADIWVGIVPTVT
jgi:AcrR family transcriptional regulator